MTGVGIRELKSRLSHYLRRVRSGERLVVTEHGEPVAVISPVPEGRHDRRVEGLIKEGIASWGGGKPKGARNPARVRGPAVATAVVEDRR